MRQPTARVAERPPAEDQVTDYDRQHLKAYARLLDADAEGADWQEVARVVLRLDVNHEPDRARRVYDAHLARARWMAQTGYRNLLT